MSQKLQNAKNLYLEGIRDGHYEAAVNAYTGARYTQHSTGVRDGKEGFIEFFSQFVANNPERHIDIVRGWEDGQYVFLQAYQDIGGTKWVTTDFFDTDENDRIIEHWDVIAPFTDPNPSGRTKVDGETEIVDEHLTEQNKAIVRGMIEDCLMGDAANIRDYFGDIYLQHNPDVGDGIDHFEKLAQDPNAPLSYDEIVLCVGKGNFVATLSKATFDGTPYCQADIFRLDDGKIVEHWDNVEVVPENDVNSGKF